MSYRHLDPDKIEATIIVLQKRIEERFPGYGLSALCGELLTIAREDRQRRAKQDKPNSLIRVGIVVAIIGAISPVVALFTSIRRWQVDDEVFNALQGVEAVVSIIAFSGAAIWFLLNLETRMRRRSVLSDLHELRSIAHVVDMHQLTRDPTTVNDPTMTPSSPRHTLNEFQLARYLDYCSEMLALTGKLAALYLHNMRDPVIIEAVNDIEDLTGNLSRKIWQKIMILQQPLLAAAMAGQPPAISAPSAPSATPGTARPPGR